VVEAEVVGVVVEVHEVDLAKQLHMIQTKKARAKKKEKMKSRMKGKARP
jgi:hypothetical protein